MAKQKSAQKNHEKSIGEAKAITRCIIRTSTKHGRPWQAGGLFSNSSRHALSTPKAELDEEKPRKSNWLAQQRVDLSCSRLILKEDIENTGITQNACHIAMPSGKQTKLPKLETSKNGTALIQLLFASQLSSFRLQLCACGFLQTC